jgi:hypothetical protein
MTINSWKLKLIDDNTPKRMLGWNIVSWEGNYPTYAMRKWIKENIQKGSYRLSYEYNECLIEKDDDVVMLMLRWS